MNNIVFAFALSLAWVGCAVPGPAPGAAGGGGGGGGGKADEGGDPESSIGPRQLIEGVPERSGDTVRILDARVEGSTLGLRAQYLGCDWAGWGMHWFETYGPSSEEPEVDLLLVHGVGQTSCTDETGDDEVQFD